MNKKKGFTLIELLVVISIIGLLATLAVVSLNSARAKARDAQRVSDVKQISTALEMYYASNGDYPVCGSYSADIAVSACTGLDLDAELSSFNDPKDSEVCVNGSTGCNYTFTVMGNDGYEICFALESGSGRLGDGLNKITTGGMLSPGCTF